MVVYPKSLFQSLRPLHITLFVWGLYTCLRLDTSEKNICCFTIYGLCKGLLSKLVRTAGRVVTRCSNCSLCGILTTIHEKTQHFDSYTRSSSCLCKQLADLSCKTTQTRELPAIRRNHLKPKTERVSFLSHKHWTLCFLPRTLESCSMLKGADWRPSWLQAPGVELELRVCFINFNLRFYA